MSVAFFTALRTFVTDFAPILGGSLDGLNAMSMDSASTGSE